MGCERPRSKVTLTQQVDKDYSEKTLGVSPQCLSIWTRVLNHNKYLEIKQFSKVDIKQNNISTVILLITFLVYQWDPRHLPGSWVVYILVYISSISYLITFLCVSIIRIHVHLIISDVHKELSSLRMKNWNRKYKLRMGWYTCMSWINRWGRILIRYSIYKWITQRPVCFKFCN